MKKFLCHGHREVRQHGEEVGEITLGVLQFFAGEVELGGQLFVAKGCIACHANNKVENASDYWRTDAGPNLTTFSASPEALRLRLKDPSSVKSDTQMPDLNLSEFEIEALIVFINSK